jgi:ATP-dependent Lon protease
MTAADDDDDFDLRAEHDDMVSTGAAADSADWDARLKGLPRLLRYAAMIVAQTEHLEQRLIAEINELCPRLPLNGAWASALDTTVGLALADQLDHRAVASNEPDLRSLADCVRLLSLPVPRDTTHFEEYRRVGKALIQAFRRTASGMEKTLRANLEGFVFGFAALPACTFLLIGNLGAAENAKYLGSLMATYRVDVAQAVMLAQAEKREGRWQATETEQQGSLPSSVATQGASLVVARLSDDEMKHSKFKDIITPLKGAINQPLPLVEMPPLREVRDALVVEFPYAMNVIDFALADLVGRSTVYLRPLLLVGDPGGGKSRFARRLGEELGVSVWRTDASQSDGAVFAGTSRRWHSAEPCHPLLAVVQGRIANPLIIIDELEKAASRSDYGRLWDSLLGFLEPETNTRYPDPALQTTLDLSQISYVATANRLEPLPSPIRDRFRVIDFPKPSADDLDALLPGIIADLATERGLDRSWIVVLDGMERAAIAQLWRGGSVRRLRRIVEAVLRQRDLRAARH